MTESPATTPIPVQLSEPEFIAFIFPHLSMPRRGPKCKLGYHRVFNLILWVLYTGMQWKCLPVPRAGDGTAVIHYTTIYKVFAKWSDDGSLDQAFIASVRHLAEQHHLDLSVLHGDGSNTVAKKGGDGIGYSGHKHQKGEKVLAIVENNGFVLAPLPVAPVNEADTVLLPDGLNALKRVARLTDLKIDGCRVEVPVARHLPHRSRRAAFPHRALAGGRARSGERGGCSAAPIRRQATGTGCLVRFLRPEHRQSSTIPPTEPPSLHALRRRSSRPCSGASPVLRGSSDSSPVPRQLRLLAFLPRPGIATATAGQTRSPRFQRDPFVRDVASDPGRATAPCMTAPHMLPSTPLTVSAPAK